MVASTIFRMAYFGPCSPLLLTRGTRVIVYLSSIYLCLVWHASHWLGVIYADANRIYEIEGNDFFSLLGTTDDGR